MGTLPPSKRAERIAIAKAVGLVNVEAIADASIMAGVPFHLACALVEKESGGRNIYGHDVGGTNSVRTGDIAVTPGNFLAFLVRVMNGAQSNGVGPLQVTYAGTLKGGHRDGGYFRLMIEKGLMPWDPVDSMTFALRDIFVPLLSTHRQVWLAGAHWNGGTTPDTAAQTYGRDLALADAQWKLRFAS